MIQFFARIKIQHPIETHHTALTAALGYCSVHGQPYTSTQKRNKPLVFLSTLPGLIRYISIARIRGTPELLATRLFHTVYMPHDLSGQKRDACNDK